MLGWDPARLLQPAWGCCAPVSSWSSSSPSPALIGILWNPRFWLKNAFLFYAVYIFFYTSMFTNGSGFFSGIIGSLGYWLNQQGEQRGGQPWYYFAGLQMPVYEYLAVAWRIPGLLFWPAPRPLLASARDQPGRPAARSTNPPDWMNLPRAIGSVEPAGPARLDLPVETVQIRLRQAPEVFQPG